MNERKAAQRERLAGIWLVVLAAAVLAVAVLWWGAARAQAGEPVPMSNEQCLGCHQTAGMTMTLAGGEKLPLSVEGPAYGRSVHGGKLACMACHAEITSVPHPPLTATDRRDYSLKKNEVCKTCHLEQHNQSLDSVHYRQLAAGNRAAPLCSDCHGVHDISNPHQPRAKISQTCSQCHKEINDQYVKSVHGKALTTEGNSDVPVCTSCHGVHRMEDPRTARFRVESPELCANCHTNPAIMSKYGISTDVYQTYVEDFHGMTVSLYERQSPDTLALKAVCTDCHGIHDIKKTDDPESTVIRANLVNTCRKCHPEATPNFPTAWLHHYNPDAQRFPIVYFARLFYTLVIPIFVAGLALHVILDMWRSLRQRRTRGGD